MKTFSWILFVSFSVIYLLPATGKAQYNYVSKDNTSLAPANWNDANTWTIANGSPSNASLQTPGQPSTHTQLGTVDIYGYTLLTGNLTVTQANPIFNVIDTLFIDGNLTFGTNARLYIEPTGILIVKGNLKMQGSAGIENSGNMVVTGNLNVTNGYLINFNKSYVYGNTTKSGGGKVNGCDNWNNCSNVGSTNAIANESDLLADNKPLYDFVSSGNVPLPVELLFFKAESRSQQALLQWATAQEENFDYFTVEKSKDGLQYTSIGKIYGSGVNTKDRTDYEFSDPNPFSGTSYYRLKSTDYDGSVEYFRPVYVSFENTIAEAAIFPNPGFGETINLQLADNDLRKAEFQLISSTGQLVYQKTINSIETSINFETPLKKGTYIAIIKTSHTTSYHKWLVE